MNFTDYQTRQALQQLDHEALSLHQLNKLNALLAEILPDNAFYRTRLSRQKNPLESLDQLEQIPYTFKEDLLENANDHRFAANLTWNADRYVHMHRTSGTRGRPLIVMDTQSDWQWWIDCWQYVLDAGGITEQDRVLMAFSFGPFIGFWSAHDAVIHRGSLVAPAGGMSTVARIDLMRTIGATALFCTPSYALHMAEVAEENQTNIVDLPVEKIVVAGEPGGSIPDVRNRIESAWQARVVDHAGASEVGAWGFADAKGKGIFINEAEFIAEFISVESGAPAGEGELSELVLTTLGRSGSPVIRYRTGDLVRPSWNNPENCCFVFLDGGVLGRVDDMLIVRGVNIFPSSIEQILRSFPEIIEFRMTASKQSEMDTIQIEIEDRLEKPQRVARELEVRLGLKVQVQCVPVGSLPRFELKGQRFIDNRRAVK